MPGSGRKTPHGSRTGRNTASARKKATSKAASTADDGSPVRENSPVDSMDRDAEKLRVGKLRDTHTEYMIGITKKFASYEQDFIADAERIEFQKADIVMFERWAKALTKHMEITENLSAEFHDFLEEDEIITDVTEQLALVDVVSSVSSQLQHEIDLYHEDLAAKRHAEHNPAPAPAPARSRSHSPARRTLPCELKLPKFELQEFSGNQAEFRSFIDIFNATIHKSTLPNVQKLTYLKGVVK